MNFSLTPKDVFSYPAVQKASSYPAVVWKVALGDPVWYRFRIYERPGLGASIPYGAYRLRKREKAALSPTGKTALKPNQSQRRIT